MVSLVVDRGCLVRLAFGFAAEGVTGLWITLSSGESSSSLAWPERPVCGSVHFSCSAKEALASFTSILFYSLLF